VPTPTPTKRTSLMQSPTMKTRPLSIVSPQLPTEKNLQGRRELAQLLQTMCQAYQVFLGTGKPKASGLRGKPGSGIVDLRAPRVQRQQGFLRTRRNGHRGILSAHLVCLGLDFLRDRSKVARHAALPVQYGRLIPQRTPLHHTNIHQR
jgi:hypothetical protein